MILDEVATGFGRTGTLFAAEQLGFEPDFLCLGKALTNGYLPLAATLTTESVYRAFGAERAHTFFHGHTYTGNALACAAALASLELLARERTLERAAAIGAELRVLLAELERDTPEVYQVRQTGLMVGIELRQPDGIPYNYNYRMGDRVCMAARDFGVVLRPLGDVIVLMPPPAMSIPQIRTLVAGVKASIEAVFH